MDNFAYLKGTIFIFRSFAIRKSQQLFCRNKIKEGRKFEKFNYTNFERDSWFLPWWLFTWILSDIKSWPFSFPIVSPKKETKISAAKLNKDFYFSFHKVLLAFFFRRSPYSSLLCCFSRERKNDPIFNK